MKKLLIVSLSLAGFNIALASPSKQRLWPKQRSSNQLERHHWNGRGGYNELNPDDKPQNPTQPPPSGRAQPQQPINFIPPPGYGKHPGAPLYLHNFNIPQHQQHTFAEFETRAQKAPTASAARDYFSSVLVTARAYSFNLLATSPDLFAVSAASIAIFIFWRLPVLHHLLQSNFICNWQNIQSMRIYVLATSAVSHISFLHIFMNLVTFLSFGPQVKQTLASSRNRWPLWPMLLGSATTGNLCHLLLGRRNGCLGLSGVTLSLLAFMARLHPDRILAIRLMGILPIQIPAQVLLQILLGWSFLGCFWTSTSVVSHVTHLGGLLFGMAYCELWKRRLAKQRANYLF